ncbi:MAG: signal peptidase II, partial [Clostridium sp.]
MKKDFNKDKLLTIGILPIMWLLYFLFEIFTGRVKDIYTLILNLSLVIVFGLVGLFIYTLGLRYANGFNTKKVFAMFTFLLIVDQGIKIIINSFFFHEYFEIIPKFLSFNPIINTDGSWLNARFGTGISFPFLIFINALALILFLELYRYYIHKGNKD